MDLPSAFIHPCVQLTPDFCENCLSLITSHSHWWERIPILAFGDGQTQDTAPERFRADSSHVCIQSAGGGRAGNGGCTWELSEQGTVWGGLCGFVLMRQRSASHSPGRRWWACWNNSAGGWGTELQDSGSSRNCTQSSLEESCLTRWPSLWAEWWWDLAVQWLKAPWFQTNGQHITLGRIWSSQLTLSIHAGAHGLVKAYPTPGTRQSMWPALNLSQPPSPEINSGMRLSPSLDQWKVKLRIFYWDFGERNVLFLNATASPDCDGSQVVQEPQCRAEEWSQHRQSRA